MRTLIEHLDFALTVDAEDRVIGDAALVIEDERIADLGPSAEVLARHSRDSFDEIVDGRLRGVCPGFVDSHVHLSETLSRAVFPDNLATRPWVFEWAKPFYAAITPEDEEVGIELAVAEMLRSGTTCFLDMGCQNDTGVAVRVVERAGIRGIVGRHAADVRPREIPRGWTEAMMRHHFFPDAATALAELERMVRLYHGAASGRIRCWVNIEGKEPCSLELHVGARRLAERLGVGTTYHLATSIEEARVCEKKHGCWPITRIAENGGLGSNLVIAHGVAVTDPEVDLLAAHDTKVAFCPSTSLKLAKGAACIGKYPEMLEKGVTVGLGTDGVSAAGNVNLMRQMFLVAGLFKDARLDPTLVGARKALRMATIDGARALAWDDEIGSLEVGKKADFIVFDLDHIEWTPHQDPLMGLVWAASVASIAETWVDGRRLYREGRLATLDEADIKRRARVQARRTVERSGLSPDTPVTSTAYDE